MFPPVFVLLHPETLLNRKYDFSLYMHSCPIGPVAVTTPAAAAAVIGKRGLAHPGAPGGCLGGEVVGEVVRPSTIRASPPAQLNGAPGKSRCRTPTRATTPTAASQPATAADVVGEVAAVEAALADDVVGAEVVCQTKPMVSWCHQSP